MRKVVLLGVVAVLGLAGCSAPAPAGSKVDQQAVYLSAWHDRFPNSDDAAAVRVGKGICDAYDSGSTFAGEVAYLMRLAPMTAEQAGYMIGVSTSAFCPKYANRH